VAVVRSDPPKTALNWPALRTTGARARATRATRDVKPDPTKESSTQDLSPRFSGALDNFTPVKAGGAGVALSALNPKNLLLTVAGAAAIAETGIPAGQQAGAYAVLVVIASLRVATAVVIFFALGDRSTQVLDGLKTWLAMHNNAIMAVLMLVIGVKLIDNAISGFST